MEISKQKIRIAILDDHQITIDGYEYRLHDNPNLEIVVTARTGEELANALETQSADILLLDVSVPNSDSDSNQIPLLYFIPELIANYPSMHILVISMHNQKNLIQSVMEAGAKGYIVKDDRASILKLSKIISSIADGGYYFSDDSFKSLFSDGKLSRSSGLPTARQLQVLSLCASRPEATTADIAAQLSVAPSTLRNLLSDCYKRLDVSNRGSAIEKARSLGLISSPPT